MSIWYHSHPAQFRGRGTVYLAFDVDGGSPHWTGYWELEPDGPPTPLEEGPGWTSPNDAVEWGRARSARVLIRLDDSSGYLWAGKGEPPDDDAIEGVSSTEAQG